MILGIAIWIACVWFFLIIAREELDNYLKTKKKKVLDKPSDL